MFISLMFWFIMDMVPQRTSTLPCPLLNLFNNPSTKKKYCLRYAVSKIFIVMCVAQTEK